MDGSLARRRLVRLRAEHAPCRQQKRQKASFQAPRAPMGRARSRSRTRTDVRTSVRQRGTQTRPFFSRTAFQMSGMRIAKLPVRHTTKGDPMTTQPIDSLESFDIHGMAQWVLLRGDLRSRRVLLIVQQGPGFPLIHEANALEQRLHLEAGAVVAYWDQRGTGKSWDANPSTINLVQLVADVRAMVDGLCARLGVDQVDILGLSIGGTLATLAAAQSPARIGHIVAVGVDVDWGESERYAYAFACDEAARRGDRRAQRQLEGIGAPPHDTSRTFLTRVRWATAYGGIHRHRGFFGLLWENVR